MGKEPRNIWKDLLEASTAPLNLVVSTFIGLAIGYGLDSLFGTSPYLTIIFLILGIIAGFRELFRFARRQARNGDGKEDK
ncbi:MAG TPA: AtpZ/AtpI family protein [Nitrospirae bacterium]|nr:AtpZ/AtpI family protein [Nitrospirota bacterium]